ncbi:MAG: SLBB domain-containing protein [Gemmatimonadaceae bacterium]
MWNQSNSSSGPSLTSQISTVRNHFAANDLPDYPQGRSLSMPTAMKVGMNSSALPASTLHLWSVVRRLAPVVMFALVVSGDAGAQTNPAMQPMSTRADLTALAARLERGSNEERTQAAALQARLREGDFRPGDRLALVIEGNVTLADSAVAVTSGPKITLPDIGDIPLAGILRSELQGQMTTQLAKFVRDARVRATPLVRVSVLGPVGRPGFYFMPADIPISDAVMRAGGPAANADLARSKIKRGTDELYDAKNTQTAINEGLTLDQLSLRSGDEILVGTQSTRSWQSIASTVSVVTSLIIAVSYVFAR